MHLGGCHATIFLLGTGALTDCPGWSQRCLQTYLERCHKCKCGLANAHLAFVADPTHPVVSNHQVGVWFPLQQLVFRTPRPARRRWTKGKDKKTVRVPQPPPPVDVHHNYTPLEELITSLDTSSQSETQSGEVSPDSNRVWGVEAGQLHALLDKPPWRPGEYAIIDVHWLMGEDPVPSPSTAVYISGALLRLRKWHKMHLEIVTSRKDSDRECVQHREWFDVVEARVCSTDTWTDGLGVIWRGALHFTERRRTMKQACRKTVVFPGFSLTLHTDAAAQPLSDDITSSSTLLRDVGLPDSWCALPTHLEVVQILDTTTLPLLWVSPLHCSLSLNNTSYGDSKLLLRELFKGQKTGLLVRLCFAEESKPPVKHKTTTDWNKHIQSVDETDFCSSPSHSPLAAYETGPLLAVFPSVQSNSRGMSCDAQFLWKPEAINSGPFLHKSVCSDGKLCLTLPAINITGDQQAAPNRKVTVSDLSPSHLVEELCQRAASLKHIDFSQLDLPPSKWPEIKALSTYEWIQRKLVCRVTTPDLMFGQMVAPPPSTSSTKTCMDADDLLQCFHDTGSPVTSELSPITSDLTDVTKVHDPGASGDTVPSFESISAGTPGRKKRYHGVGYCLHPEDATMDARLTRIQQRYLLSERASNCSSSNTPEVKLEQRRRRRLRRMGTDTHNESGRDKSSTEAAQERLELIPRQQKGEEEGTEKRNKTAARVGVDCDSEKAREKEELVAANRPTEQSTGSTGVKSPVMKLHRVQTPPSAQSGLSRLTSKLKATQSSVEQLAESIQDVLLSEKPKLELHVAPSGASRPATVEVEASSNQCTSGVKLSRSPVVKLHRVQTPPSAHPVRLLSRLTGKRRATQSPEEPHSESIHVEDGPPPEKPRLELTLNDASQPNVEPSSDQCSSGSVCSKLRSSPRRNKWIAGKTCSSETPRNSKQTSKSNKKKLEQIIVVTLKNKGMKRDHVCFRKCYNRLFNLSKSFLKDLRSSKALVSEMHRVVEFNVPQVIDFELRQAHTSL